MINELVFDTVYITVGHCWDLGSDVKLNISTAIAITWMVLTLLCEFVRGTSSVIQKNNSRKQFLVWFTPSNCVSTMEKRAGGRNVNPHLISSQRVWKVDIMLIYSAVVLSINAKCSSVTSILISASVANSLIVVPGWICHWNILKVTVCMK